MREAMFWSAEKDRYVRCTLCPHLCRIAPGARGVCHVRENHDGVLYSLNYGRIVASNVDPIEKKPLYHYVPGSQSFSVAAAGCNMHCRHCQNASISQVEDEIPGEDIEPRRIVAAAQRSGCRTIAYTYTEPTIYYETMLETATLARDVGLENIMISNGYIEAEPFARLAPLLHAANVDLKAFNDKVYRQLCGARLQPILESLQRIYAAGVWLEVTTLVIPGYNDDHTQLKAIAGFIAAELGPEVPWHVSAFYPTYRLLDVPPTPEDTIRRACEIGTQAGLQHVYGGNVAGVFEHTLCPACGNVVVKRSGYRIVQMGLKAGKCGSCGADVAGVWE
ncbi:MAG: AmmeMemoRadiSam system radical SAM enzyme [Geobacteraceae bacterium]|nr:AmmeMemoRadiSam system radical SAM enzyme [Geobacteraceae bacterium]